MKARKIAPKCADTKAAITVNSAAHRIAYRRYIGAASKYLISIIWTQCIYDTNFRYLMGFTSLAMSKE